MGLSDLFIVTTLPSDGYGLFQLLTLAFFYGYILNYASNLISDGSELLLLIPAFSNVIGSIILPILGAVPDGCIVMFSGLGPNAQEELNVGIGALAGSTIMLLTIPWFLSIIGGRVSVDPSTRIPNYQNNPKLLPSDSFSLLNAAVKLSPDINTGAIIMIITSLTYLILQLPALIYLNQPVEVQANGEYMWAFGGTFVCIFLFIAYLLYQYRLSNQPDTIEALSREDYIRQAIRDGKVTLLGVAIYQIKSFQQKSADTPMTESTGLTSSYRSNSKYISENESVSLPNEFIDNLERLLRPFFNHYDHDHSGNLSCNELSAVFRDLGETVTTSQLNTFFNEMDRDRSGTIEYNEFIRGVAHYIFKNAELLDQHDKKYQGVLEDVMQYEELMTSHPTQFGDGGKSVDNESTGFQDSDTESMKNGLDLKKKEADGDDDEEIPDEFRHLSPKEQQRQIWNRSFRMMCIGTLLVLIISDPMVDVLHEIGVRLNIPAFYVAFVLAPIASNASELISAYNYSCKKTPQSITISLATLQGAAVMNNTFVLAVFMILIVTKHLAWEYFAETFSILLIQMISACMAMKKSHNLMDGLIILALYPISLCIVAGLEHLGFN